MEGEKVGKFGRIVCLEFEICHLSFGLDLTFEIWNLEFFFFGAWDLGFIWDLRFDACDFYLSLVIG